MVLRQAYLCVLASVFLMGCDRPFVAIDPPNIEVLSPDLSEVQIDEEIDLRLRVTGLRRVTRVEINSEEAAASTEADVFEYRTSLSEGTNTLIVDAIDADGEVGRDTLFAVYLPYSTATIAAATLPKPLANHTATTMADGRLLVAGGFESSGAPSATAYSYAEQGFDFLIDDLPDELAKPRGGHTASFLQDGRILVVGGSSTADPENENDFITAGELFDPKSGEFASLDFGGEPVQRAFHTATTLSDDGRNFVYLYGGRGIANGSTVMTRSDITVLEVRSHPSGDSLINVSPGGAVGAFPAVANHIQLPLSEQSEFLRSIAAGTYEPPGGGESNQVAFRFLYTPSMFFFPFEVFEEAVPPMQTRRIGHAAATLLPRHPIMIGGKDPGGTVLEGLEAFSDEAGRFYSFPASITLRTARYSHTATLLPSGRILILGGINSAGTTISTAEFILPALP